MPDSTPEGSEGEYSLDEEDQLQPEDTLVDRGVDDVLDEGYSPPERPLGLDAYGTTAAEQREGETLDQRLAEEEPDPALEDDDAEILDDNEVGRLRSGRLVAEDEGVGEDEEKDLVASDIGIDGERRPPRRPRSTSSTRKPSPTNSADAASGVVFLLRRPDVGYARFDEFDQADEA